LPKDTTSPFRPGLPVSVEYFVGRTEQVEVLRRKVGQAQSGRLEVGFVTGERGIGKSSLGALIRVLAENEGMAGVHVLCGNVQTSDEVARRVLEGLLKGSSGKGWEKKISALFGDQIKQVGLFGVTLEFAPGGPTSRRSPQTSRRCSATFHDN